MTQHTDSMQTNRTATLMLDDGTVFRGYSFGYERPVAGEGGVQYRYDRISGELDGPFVRRPVDGVDLSARW